MAGTAIDAKFKQCLEVIASRSGDAATEAALGRARDVLALLSTEAERVVALIAGADEPAGTFASAWAVHGFLRGVEVAANALRGVPDDSVRDAAHAALKAVASAKRGPLRGVLDEVNLNACTAAPARGVLDAAVSAGIEASLALGAALAELEAGVMADDADAA
jgi:hypothetical protein